jgi:hypothetical protein
MERPEHCIGAPVLRKARKAHVCKVCLCLIERGSQYVQDIAWAPHGEGARYCVSCSDTIDKEWEAWRKRE